MARPKGSLLVASDALITGTTTWDGLPTKVTPSAGIIAQGFRPGRRIPSGFLNYYLAETKAECSYQDAIEVQNWSAGVDVLDPTSAANPVSMCFVAGQKANYFACEAVVYRSGQGRTWVAESLPGSGPTAFTFISTDGTRMVGGGGYAGILTNDGSTWALVATASVTEYKCAIAWNPGGFRFMLGGASVSVNPRIVTLATNLTTTNIISKSMPTGYTDGTITHIAAAQNNTLSACVALCGNDPGASDTAVFYSTDAVTWTASTVAGCSRVVLEFWYDEFRALFYVVDNAGNLFSSADGITYADTLVDLPVDSSKPNALAQYGGVWVLTASSNKIKWSVDAGVSWNELQYDPFDDGPTGTQPFGFTKAVFTRIPAEKDGSSGSYNRGDRFAIIARPADNTKHAISFSLRCR